MKDTMQIEMDRVRRLLADAVAEIEAEGGDIRLFTVAFTRACFELCAEVEGPGALAHAAARMSEHDRRRLA